VSFVIRRKLLRETARAAEKGMKEKGRYFRAEERKKRSYGQQLNAE